MASRQQMIDVERRRALGVQLCTTCKVEKPWGCFTAVKGRRPFGRRNMCKPCYADYERNKRRHFFQSYDINVEQWNEMYTAQKGVCGICEQPEVAKNPKGSVKRLSVDHCHLTGVIRGLLCTNCNHALGKLKDSVIYLTRAVEYLKRAHGEATGTCGTTSNST